MKDRLLIVLVALSLLLAASAVASPAIAEDALDSASSSLDNPLASTDTAESTAVYNPPKASVVVNATSLNTSEAVGLDGTPSSDPNEGDSLTYNWTFDDGATASGSTSSHRYFSAGTYTVELTVTDQSGYTDTATVNLTVNDAPHADGNMSDTKLNVSQSARFNASASSDPNANDSLSYEWHFGNGDIATGETIDYAYDTAGNYTVTLVVTDSYGKTATKNWTVSVNSAPTANATATPTTVNTGENVTFDGSNSSDPEGDALTYEWDFDGDGTTDATGATVNHSYASGGTYLATLTVTDSHDVSDTANVSISVNNAPTANATASPTTVNVNETVVLDGSNSSDPDGDNLTYEWDFESDGTIDATGATVNHSYSSSGNYSATLTVTDAHGESDTANVTVSVNNAPTANATASPTTVKTGESVTFDGSNSSDPEGDALTYEWDFDGDGTIDATGVTTTHSYSESGTYEAAVTVTDEHGASATDTVSVSVEQSVPTDGLVAHWKHDGNTTDSAGSNDGVDNGITFTDGIRGMAGSYSSYSWVDVSSLDVGGYTSMSYAVWVKPSSITSTSPHHGANTNDDKLVHLRTNSNDVFSVDMGSNDELYAYLDTDSGSDSLTTSSSPLQAGEWRHVVVTWDGNSVTLYVNGSQVDSTNVGGSIVNDSPAEGGLGRHAGDSSGYVDGLMDDVRVYDRALNASEVETLYNATK